MTGKVWMMAALICLSTAAEAQLFGKVKPENQKLVFLLHGAPKGTSCTVEGTRGKIVADRDFVGTPRITVTGYAAEGMVVCALPDGRRYGSTINQTFLGDGTFKALKADAKINPEGTGGHVRVIAGNVQGTQYNALIRLK